MENWVRLRERKKWKNEIRREIKARIYLVETNDGKKIDEENSEEMTLLSIAKKGEREKCRKKRKIAKDKNKMFTHANGCLYV